MSGAWTKGPWRCNGNQDGREIAGGNGCVVTMARRDGKISTQEARANAARIVDCVNACEGIADPSVVPELVEALEELTDYLIVNSIESERGARLSRSLKALKRAKGES
ncbi:MAG: hypothetical protein HRT64_08915 [Erythrobacter sp.]|nr:hypothetical protein [Erythrobacter sp.]